MKACAEAQGHARSGGACDGDAHAAQRRRGGGSARTAAALRGLRAREHSGHLVAISLVDSVLIKMF